jgi:hypothetical protein
MTSWNRFLTACIVVGGLLLKVNAPLAAILLGLGSAALVTWQVKRRHEPEHPGRTGSGLE